MDGKGLIDDEDNTQTTMQGINREDRHISITLSTLSSLVTNHDVIKDILVRIHSRQACGACVSSE